jgi:hypothetical protein
MRPELFSAAAKVSIPLRGLNEPVWWTGEYGYRPLYFRQMLAAGAVDVLQADASRCGGPTGFLRAASRCDGWQLPLSAHCAPALHLHACLAAPRFLNLEDFHDHVRIEHVLFDGAPSPQRGELSADLSRPGLGLELKRADAERFATWLARARHADPFADRHRARAAMPPFGQPPIDTGDGRPPLSRRHCPIL